MLTTPKNTQPNAAKPHAGRHADACHNPDTQRDHDAMKLSIGLEYPSDWNG
jgi:hypothetical protein